MSLAPVFDFPVETSTSELFSSGVRKLLGQIRPHWNINNLEIDNYKNALTNTIFCVQCKPDNEKLIFRIYGSGTGAMVDRTNEIECFQLLNHHGLAPPIHARFSNGFVIGYLPGRVINAQEIRQPQIIEKICQKLSRIHQIPVGKRIEPFLFAKFRQFLCNLPDKFEDEAKQKKYVTYFQNADFNALFEEMRAEILNAENLELVLCHNDLLINNILYDEVENEVHIIDFEYMSVNYQLFELATLFNGWAGGGQNIDFTKCPSIEEKRQFLQIYLRLYLGHEPRRKELDEMVSIIPVFQAASHFLWSIWYLVRANALPIDSNYFEYGFRRYGEYVKIWREYKNGK